MQTTRAKQRGLSLVELMVALLIGVILTSGVISVYITSKTSYSMNMGLGQVQEAGRFALQTLQPILVMGGNLGCKHPQPDVALTDNSLPGYATEPVYDMRKPVYGFEYTGTGTGGYLSDSTAPGFSNSPTVDANAGDWSPSLSPLISNAIKTYAIKYSDVLVVHEALPSPATIATTGTSTTVLSYVTTNAPAMVAGQVLLASNCSPANWSAFQAGAVTAHTVTPGTAVTAQYNHRYGDTVGPIQTFVFFVGKSTIDHGTSLFETYLDTSGSLVAPVEIVPGVENMQVLYGEDTTFVPPAAGGADEILTPDYYKTADNVADWTRVVSVRVALVVHSDANSVDKAPSVTTAFHMLGTSYTDSFNYRPYPDRRMRRYFAQTFSLRNSLP